MPVCKKCGTNFPFNLKINGKLHNIKNRKFCIECSPFGKHNTKNLVKNILSNECQPYTCTSCNREFTYKRKSGHTKNKCNSCLTKERRLKIKLKCIEYKGGACSICGYFKCHWCLCFHHLDPSKKDFDITRGISYRNWEKIKQELDKCVLLCSNCHGEVHFSETSAPGRI